MTARATSPTRERILNSAAELMRRRGYAGTGLKAILSASGAPFGSLYHFFPGGKEELAVETLRRGGMAYLALVESFYTVDGDVVAATELFFEGAASFVESTGFVDACPIATIAGEIASTSEPMRATAASAFESWISVLEDRLAAAGIDKGRARDIAIELFCAIEGAFLLARTTRNAEPVRIAGRAARSTVAAALDSTTPATAVHAAATRSRGA